MYIQRIRMENLRNLESVSLSGFSDLNILAGANGAGKTSFLEGVAIAGMGRSFRSHKIQTIIRSSCPFLSVFVEGQDESGVRRIGIERDMEGGYRVRLDGKNITSLAELSRSLPILVLDPAAFSILDGAPADRRGFMDWGVFHVERGFHESWRSCSRILKQRNALLRSGVTNYAALAPWDKELAHWAAAVEASRQSFLAQFFPSLAGVISRIDCTGIVGAADQGKLTLVYRSGWAGKATELSLSGGSVPSADAITGAVQIEQMLQESFPRDSRDHFSHLGPHKADMQIRIGGVDVRELLSRGQKKILIAAMKLAQAQLVRTVTGRRPILLLDDLPSELDADHLASFIRYVLEESWQCFVSTVHADLFHTDPARARMFHVERGKITPLP